MHRNEAREGRNEAREHRNEAREHQTYPVIREDETSGAYTLTSETDMRPIVPSSLIFITLLAVPPMFGEIRNIDKFLDQCPTNDPVLARIRGDFEIRRDSSPTTLPSCTEPVSRMPSNAYTDELMLLQALRSSTTWIRG
jgi:hypothetical protein